MAQPSDPIQAPHKKATEERACVAWILILTLTVDLYPTSPAMLATLHVFQTFATRGIHFAVARLDAVTLNYFASLARPA
jgi:hypothetical protein